MKIARAGIVSGKTACSRSCHRVVQTIEQSHARQIITDAATDGEHEVDAPNPLGLRTQPRMHSGTNGAGSLRREHFHVAVAERGKDGDGEEDDSQSTYPLRHGAPEKQAVGQAFHIVENATTSCGKARYGLEIGIGEVVDIPTDEERE